MTTVAEGIAYLKAQENVVLARFESVEKMSDVGTTIEGEPPQIISYSHQYSIVTVRVIKIKGLEATQEFVKAVCYDFGGSQEAVYLLVDQFTS